MLHSSSADCFSNLCFKKILPGIPSVSNSLDPDQDGHFVGPDLGRKCLLRLSAANKSGHSWEDLRYLPIHLDRQVTANSVNEIILIRYTL